MEKPIVSRGINPCALSDAQKESLVQRLFAVHNQIFDGVDRATFQQYLLAPHAERTRIYTFSNAAGQVVGYIAVHDLLADVGGKRLRILRTEVGLLRAFRGHNAALKILVKEGFRAWFQNRCRNLWFMATPVHPNPYCATAGQMAEMYPRPGRVVPSGIQQLMAELAEKLRLEPGNSRHKWQRRVGWRVRNTSDERERLHQSGNPFVQFYLRQNPDYEAGFGLMVLVPCHIPNAIAAFRNLLRKAAKGRRKKRSRRESHCNSRSSRVRNSSPLTPLSLAFTKIIRSSTRP